MTKASIVVVIAALASAGCQFGQPDAVTPAAPAATTASPASGRIDEELALRKLAPDTYLVVHEPFVSANVLVAKMPDGAVVIASSPMETHASRALVTWVKAALSPTRIVAINTHFHFDGTGGNEAYREAGVITYASTLTQKLLAEKGASMQVESAKGFDGVEKDRMLAMKITPAEKTFDEREGLVLSFGGEDVRVIYPGAGHSPDNVIVFFPSRRVLFGGCMIKGSKSVGYIGHADLDHWEAAVDVARGLEPKIVVPGHGPPGGPELFDLTATVVREARAKGK